MAHRSAAWTVFLTADGKAALTAESWEFAKADLSAGPSVALTGVLMVELRGDSTAERRETHNCNHQKEPAAARSAIFCLSLYQRPQRQQVFW